MLRRIPLLRTIALLLAFAWLAAGLSSQIHHLMVQHVVCPEHGKIQGIHLEDGDHHDLAQLASPEDSRFHGDHGCLFLAGFFSSPPPAVVEAPVHVWSPPGVTAPIADALGARAPPLRFAPKTSPPLA
jgi:hypothetical protein